MPKRILIIDDSKTAQMMQTMLLKREGYDVITANDGDEGLARALAEHPDLILLDVVMPRMGGFEALGRLRADESMRATPVLLVTTRGELANVQTGYETGCTDYITKPIDSVEFIAKIKTYLGE